MIELLLNSNHQVPARPGFWRRQFTGRATDKQRVFDWIFGIILPVLCFAVDPIVFKTSMGTPLFGAMRPFAYMLSFVSVMAMIAWQLWGERLGGLSSFLAGLFAAGAAISLGVGITLLPFSLVGLIIVIGALGFTPLFTSIVFARNAARAFQSSGAFFARRTLVHAFVLSGLFSLVVPFVVNVTIKRSVDGIVRGDVESIERNARLLRLVGPLVDPTPIAQQYGRICTGSEHERTAALAQAYSDITGSEVRAVTEMD
jgi:hypothetical protein